MPVYRLPLSMYCPKWCGFHYSSCCNAAYKVHLADLRGSDYKSSKQSLCRGAWGLNSLHNL